MSDRLNAQTVRTLPKTVAVPGYDRTALPTGIVHMGIGAFHRAHQAVYTDTVLGQRGGPWGICGVSLLPTPEIADALNPQDGLYAMSARDGTTERLRVVGSIKEVLIAPHAPGAVMARLTVPDTRIVSITVTEKGYCHSPATGTLDESHPDILHDVENPAAPKTLAGWIVEALRQRRAAGLAPFTVLSCDNLPDNGIVTRNVVLRYADLVDPALARWIEDTVAFPCTMVDRITPPTTADDIAAIATSLGVRDAWPVVTEAFTQWAIEDHFTAGRPEWELAGAELVPDVRPYELMKLRLLNGSHSCLAYLGYLAGFDTIAETMTSAAFRRYATSLMRTEVAPTLTMPAGTDLHQYTESLIARFSSTALKHRTWQIAMDGSQKLPQRLLGPVADRLAAGQPFERLALGIAGWMRYVTGTDERGAPIDVRDPLAAELAAIARETGPVAERLAPALIAERRIFGAELAGNDRFVSSVTAALGRLYGTGAMACVEALTEG